MTTSQQTNPLPNSLIVLNVLSLFLYSPNFFSVVFPAVKALQLAVFMLTFAYLLMITPQRIDRLTLTFLLFLAFVVLSAIINFLRFSNVDSLYLVLSYLVKTITVLMLFRLCRRPADLDWMLKLCVMVLAGYALHGILQFFVVVFGLVSPLGSIEMMGYDFVNLGWAGIYRVSFTLGSLNLVRIQSFFQEPGFFAFYLLFGLILLDCVRARMPFPRARLCAGIFIFALLMTLSLTGIVLMLAYLVVKSRSLLFRAIAVSVALLAIDFIVFNESEFIAKAGSLDMRLEHFSLIETLVASWENILFGIGFGNEALISEMRVNNFIPELVMYSSVFGLITVLVILALAMQQGRKTNHILLMVLLYSLSTPMLWSPLFVLAVFISWRIPRFPHVLPRPAMPVAS